jgi:hypothetical protein
VDLATAELAPCPACVATLSGVGEDRSQLVLDLGI